MDSTEAITQAKELAGHFMAPTGNATWADYLAFTGWDWSYELLAQLVLLVGDREVIYATGYVEDEPQAPWARVAVFTRTSVIEGGYSPKEPGGPARAWARSSNLRSIAVVRLLEAGPLSVTSGSWPRKLSIELSYAKEVGLPPFTVPIEPMAREESTATLASFLPMLQDAMNE